MKKQSNTPGHEAHPQLSYYGKALIVDHAWADARNQKVLLELDGLLFSVPLAPPERREAGSWTRATCSRWKMPPR